MIDKIKKFFTYNILWKVVAFMLAMILWFVAVNIENPTDFKTFNVKLQIRNPETLKNNGLVLLNEESIKDTNISISVRATTKVLNQKLSNTKIKAYLDMEAFSVISPDKIGVELPLQITYELPAGLEADAEVYKLNPTAIKVIVDHYETRDFPVNVVISKKQAEGYIDGEAAVEPSVVSISGAKSILDSISVVNIGANLDGTTEDFATTDKLIVYDNKDKDITSKVSLNTPSATVRIPINKSGEIPVKKPEIIGYVMPGYTITNITVEPEIIEVVGKASEIEALKEIIIDSVSVTGATSDQVFQRDVRDFLRSTSLNVKNATPHEITVTVKIEKDSTKVFALDTSKFTVVGDKTKAKFAESLNVSLKGTETVMNGVKPENIKGKINIEGLTEGTHNVEVEVDLPIGVAKVPESLYISVTILGEEDGKEETETQGPTTTPTADLPTDTNSTETPPIPTDEENPVLPD